MVKITDEGVEEVLQALRKGDSLFKACKKANITTKDFYDRIEKSSKLKELYLLALADYADSCTDEIKGIVGHLKEGEMDNSTAKLLIETFKWLALKACPEPYLVKESEDIFGAGERTKEIVVKFI